MPNVLDSFRILVRHYAKHYFHPWQRVTKIKTWKNGKDYGLVTYFPRYPEHEDPKINPTKLFLIERVKPYAGQPYWNKEILDRYGISGKRIDERMAVVKNTPSICKDLWSIKHLIKVLPLNVPEGFSEEDATLGGTFLHDNGDFQVIEKVDATRIDLAEQYLNAPKKMDRTTIRRQLRYKWLNPIA